MNKNYLLLVAFAISMVLFIPACDESFDPEDITTEIGLMPAVRITYHSVDIFWNEYDGEDFDRYEIYYKTLGEKEYKLYGAIKFSRQTFTTVYGLEPSTDYSVYLKAVNTKGSAYESKPLTFKTSSNVPSPVKIYPINEVDVSHSMIRIRWSSYIDEDIVDFDKYEIYCTSFSPAFVPSKEYFFASVNKMIDTVIDVTNLLESTTYYFKVRSYNSLGYYAESEAQQMKTKYKPPDTVFIYDPVEVTETSAIIKWRKIKMVNNPTYSIFVGEDDKFYHSVEKYRFKAGQDTMFRLLNLTKWTEYFVWIKVTDSRNLSSLSNKADFTSTIGGAPVPVTVNVALVGRNNIKLVWTDAISKYVPLGPPNDLSPYSILLSTSPGTDPNKMTGYGQTVNTYFDIQSLKPNTTYYLRVMFTNSFSRYSFSNEVVATTSP
jgi:hypothetical protein